MEMQFIEIKVGLWFYKARAWFSQNPLGNN